MRGASEAGKKRPARADGSRRESGLNAAVRRAKQTGMPARRENCYRKAVRGICGNIYLPHIGCIAYTSAPDANPSLGGGWHRREAFAQWATPRSGERPEGNGARHSQEHMPPAYRLHKLHLRTLRQPVPRGRLVMQGSVCPVGNAAKRRATRRQRREAFAGTYASRI